MIAYGKSNSGKSQLAMQAVLCAARAGAKSLYVDTEGAFRPERIDEMARGRGWPVGSLLDRIVYLRCNSAALQAETVRLMSKRKETKDCRVVVIDTLTRNFTLDLPGKENMPDRQGALNVYMSEMARDAFLNGRAYLLTNRVTFDKVNLDVGVGGRTVSQLVHTSLHLERDRSMVRITDTESHESRLVPFGRTGIGD